MYTRPMVSCARHLKDMTKSSRVGRTATCTGWHGTEPEPDSRVELMYVLTFVRAYCEVGVPIQFSRVSY